MDRIQFIGQTYQGFTSSIDDIINFFDHTMAVYEIVGDTTAANVHGITDSIGQTLKIQATFNIFLKLELNLIMRMNYKKFLIILIIPYTIVKTYMVGTFM